MCCIHVNWNLFHFRCKKELICCVPDFMYKTVFSLMIGVRNPANVTSLLEYKSVFNTNSSYPLNLVLTCVHMCWLAFPLILPFSFNVPLPFYTITDDFSPIAASWEVLVQLYVCSFLFAWKAKSKAPKSWFGLDQVGLLLLYAFVHVHVCVLDYILRLK